MKSSPGMRWTVAAILLVAAAVFVPMLTTDHSDKDSVVLYCAHDSIFADEIIRRFEQQTGFHVFVRYDEEANKSLGLANLLIAEKDAPRCDVFWNNQTLGTIRLKEHGVLAPCTSPATRRIPAAWRDPDGLWTGFAARLRVILINTDRLTTAHVDPATLVEAESLRDFAIAVPLYGTTLTHYAALAAEIGFDHLKTWHHSLRARGVREVRGNSAVKDLVAEGACTAGYTDSDDAFVALDQGKHVRMVPVRMSDGHTIVIPNSVALINNCRHPVPARALIDFLLSEETELALAASAARQIPLGPVDSSRLTPEVRELAEWADDASSLQKAAAEHPAVLEWLMTEYHQQ